jgi:hypothetical protein
MLSVQDTCVRHRASGSVMGLIGRQSVCVSAPAPNLGLMMRVGVEIVPLVVVMVALYSDLIFLTVYSLMYLYCK